MRQLTFIAPKQIEWQETEEPALEGAGQALVRPLAVALCDLDRAVIRGRVPAPGPFPLGHECVAEVIATGDAVASVRPGDRVVVSFQITCGTCGRCARGLTGSCEAVAPYAMYGLPLGGIWGGMLSDVVRVPYADAMLAPVPDGIDPVTIASASDNIPDGWRTVGPPLAAHPGGGVLIAGGGAGSIGLYAAGIAVALGAAQVDYLDSDADRLAIAAQLGANAIEHHGERRRLGPYPITVDASADPEGLGLAIRATEPGGICTSVGIYYDRTTPVPLLHMYNTGITLTTGRVHAMPAIGPVLDLVASGKLRPELVTSVVIDAADASQAALDPPTKLVIRMTPGA